MCVWMPSGDRCISPHGAVAFRPKLFRAVQHGVLVRFITKLEVGLEERTVQEVGSVRVKDALQGTERLHHG